MSEEYSICIEPKEKDYFIVKCKNGEAPHLYKYDKKYKAHYTVVKMPNGLVVVHPILQVEGEGKDYYSEAKSNFELLGGMTWKEKFEEIAKRYDNDKWDIEIEWVSDVIARRKSKENQDTSRFTDVGWFCD